MLAVVVTLSVVGYLCAGSLTFAFINRFFSSDLRVRPDEVMDELPVIGLFVLCWPVFLPVCGAFYGCSWLVKTAIRLFEKDK